MTCHKVRNYFLTLEYKKMTEEIHILGNAPSLNDVNLDLLKDKHTISFNRAYIAYEEWGWYPTYYFCLDIRVLQGIVDDVNELIRSSPIEKFFIRDVVNDPDFGGFTTRDAIIDSPKVSFIRLDGPMTIPPRAPHYGYWGDACVCSFQFLYEMGYRLFFVHGCDANYVEEPKDTEMVGNLYRSKHDSADPNHFRSDYYDSSVQYSKPCGEAHLMRWHQLAGVLRRLPDVTVFNTSKRSKIHNLFKFNDSFNF